MIKIQVRGKWALPLILAPTTITEEAPGVELLIWDQGVREDIFILDERDARKLYEALGESFA